VDAVALLRATAARFRRPSNVLNVFRLCVRAGFQGTKLSTYH